MIESARNSMSIKKNKHENKFNNCRMVLSTSKVNPLDLVHGDSMHKSSCAFRKSAAGACSANADSAEYAEIPEKPKLPK